MQFIRANTQVKVVIGPVVAVANGYVPVTTLALNTADEAEIMKHDASSVTDISGATFAAITSADGYYNLTLTTSHTDTEGLLTVLINDDSLCLPVKQTFMVLAEAAYDSMFVAKDDGFMDVNIKTVGRTDTQETEATNLEAACAAYSATRGLSGTALPAAAADAAGGLIISDAGGLDADAQRSDVAAILVDTGTTLQGELDGIQADTEDIQTRLPAALTSDGNIKADTLRLSGTLQTARDIGASVLLSSGTGTGQVTLASGSVLANLRDGAHGGTAAVITAERIVVASTTTDQPAMKLTGNGTAAGLLSTGGTSGHGIAAVGGATSGAGLLAEATGAGAGVKAVGGATNGSGLLAMSPVGVGIEADGAGATDISGNITGNLSGSVGSVTGITATGVTLAAGTHNPQTGDGYAYLGTNLGLLGANATEAGGTGDHLTALALSSAGNGAVADAVWDEAQSGHTSSGTFGKYLDAQVSTVGGGTAADIAAAVWDEAIADHLTAGTTGAKLNSAAAAGDPLSSSVPGAYSAGTAGYNLGFLPQINTQSQKITTAGVFVVDPTGGGDHITVVRGDTFPSSEDDPGTALTFTKASGEAWPDDLSDGWTISMTWTVNSDNVVGTAGATTTFNIAATVVQATGASQSVKFNDFTPATMAALSVGDHVYDFDIQAVKGTTPYKRVTMRTGTVTVRKDQTTT